MDPTTRYFIVKVFCVMAMTSLFQGRAEASPLPTICNSFGMIPYALWRELCTSKIPSPFQPRDVEQESYDQQPLERASEQHSSEMTKRQGFVIPPQNTNIDNLLRLLKMNTGYKY